MHARLRSLALAASLAAMVSSLSLPQAVAQEPEPSGDYQQVLDVTFPTRPDAWFSDTYDACRSGCERTHKAADLMGEKMWPEYAMVDGVVCRIDEGEEDSYGRHLTLCGDDGRRYRYLHLNNDTPGTDDGQAGLEHVYAPGIREGQRVARGQLLAYMGDSGNAEDTAPHLHLDIFDDAVMDPYGDNRINPYPSLVAALDRGDVADGSIVHSDPVKRVAGEDRIETAIALSRVRPVTSDVVVLARSDDPTDALVGGPLAGALDAPVLITAPERLDDRVLDEIRRREATRVVVVGTAPSAEVVRSLEGAGLAVERLAGGDRFGTADVVAARVWELTGAGTGQDVPDGEGWVSGAPVPDDAEVVLVVHPDARRRGTVALDGAEVRTEQREPYDLLGSDGRGGPTLLDTRTLANGEHVVTAVVERADAPDLEVVATLTVANGVARTALLALGENPDPTRQWPDAMVGSYYGAATAQPVLLTGPDALPRDTAGLLADVAVTVIGGPVAIDPDVVADLDVTERLAGETRYGTGVAVVERLRSTGRVDVERMWAATGTNWPDAITAGPLLAELGQALVLVDGAAQGHDGETATWMSRFADDAADGRVIGGPHAVTDDAVTAFGLRLT